MDQRLAERFASAIGGSAIPPDDGTDLWAVELIRPDGHNVHIDHDAFCVHQPRTNIPPAWDPWLLTDCELYEWGSYDWARHLAYALKGQCHHTGGNCWVVLATRPDGGYVLFCAEGANVYANREDYLSDEDGTLALEIIDFID